MNRFWIWVWRKLHDLIMNNVKQLIRETLDARGIGEKRLDCGPEAMTARDYYGSYQHMLTLVKVPINVPDLIDKEIRILEAALRRSLVAQSDTVRMNHAAFVSLANQLGYDVYGDSVKPAKKEPKKARRKK